MEIEQEDNQKDILKKMVQKTVITEEKAEIGMAQILGDILLGQWFIKELQKTYSIEEGSDISLEKLIYCYLSIYHGGNDKNLHQSYDRLYSQCQSHEFIPCL